MHCHLLQPGNKTRTWIEHKAYIDVVCVVNESEQASKQVEDRARGKAVGWFVGRTKSRTF